VNSPIALSLARAPEQTQAFHEAVGHRRHEPIIDPELFQRAQLLLAERHDSPSAQAANASDYLLTSFLRCQRCGHGFVGTAAHGNGGTYRYYTCFPRQRHGTARCDQQRLPAQPLEAAILADVLAALVDQILVESRACIQPYFVAPTVRTRSGSRRRGEHCKNTTRQVRQCGSTLDTGAASLEPPRRATVSFQRALHRVETGRSTSPSTRCLRSGGVR
jgi:hypothetical protein